MIEPSAAPATICVIDDDAFVRMTMCAALRFAGFSTTQAGDGRTGLDTIRRTGAEIAVIDLIMPGMDGFDAIAEAKKRFPKVKILAVSGGGLMTAPGELLTIARDLGADSYLPKPFKNPELIDEIARLGAHHAKQRR
jgi:CheY-like chemotaxis protein